MVSDVSFTRYMSYCPNCKKTEYKLSKTLGLRPRQRMSSQLEELSAAITDKRYMVSFVDSEALNWEIVLELYKRSGGNLDGIECLVKGDGASWIGGFREEHMPKSRYILDYYHLCQKAKEIINKWNL